MEQNKLQREEMLTLVIGELVVICVVVAGFFVLDTIGGAAFNYRVITGAVLGAVLAVAYYSLLTLSVNRAINDFMALRGERKMEEEEAVRFALQNSPTIQNSIKISFIIRTVVLAASLLVAFITDLFNPLATAIPLLALRPLISIGSTVRRKECNQ